MKDIFCIIHFCVSALDYAAGSVLRQAMFVCAKLEALKGALLHTLINLFLPNLYSYLAHQLTFERLRRIELEREIWVLKHRYQKSRNAPLCFCGRLTAIYYAIRYPYPLKKLRAHIGLSARAISRYRALLKRGISFLIPKRFRNRKPRTPDSLAHTVWSIHEENPTWGRWRIAYYLWHLGIFIAPSTVRNILLRPKPHPLGLRKEKIKEKPKLFGCSDGTWGMDFSRIKLWDDKIAWIFAVIELTSRKILYIETLASLPDSVWVINTLRNIIVCYGLPIAVVTDNGGQFRGDDIAKLCASNSIKHIFTKPRCPQTNGRIERFFCSLKYECLYRTFRISVSQIDKLCKAYVEYYNTTRPHHALDGAIPDEVFYKVDWQRPDKQEKYINGKVRKRFFCDGLLTSYYLEKVA